MKVAIFLLSLVAAVMGAPAGVYNAAYPYGYAHHPSGGAFSYSVSTGSSPAGAYYGYGYPGASYGYPGAGYGYPGAGYGYPGAGYGYPGASYYHHAPSVGSSTYHAQDSAGQYSYGYATEDGQAKVEQKTFDGSVAGKFSYMDPAGKVVETKYTAGKDGFKAEGDHLPKAPAEPEIPEEVKAAYDKATEEFEDAKNRKGPESVQPEPSSTPAPAPLPAPVPVPATHPLHYSAHQAYFLPYGAKSAYTYPYAG